MNIAHALERSAHHFPDHPAIIFEGRTITYRVLDAAAGEVAQGLLAYGVGAGDRVALFLPNIPEFIIAYFGTLKLGAVAVSLNVMLTTAELEYVLTDSGSRVLFTTADLWPRVQPLVGTLPALERVVICEGAVAGHDSITQLRAGHAGRFRAREMDRHAPAAILYTSGTTGQQKGAVLSHNNVVFNSFSTAHTFGYRHQDRAILYLPLFHCFGQNGVTNALFYRGGTVVLLRRFELEACIGAIERHGVTMFFAVPTVYINVLNAGIDPRRLSSVRYCLSAAATLPEEVARRWQQTYGLTIFEGYGMTETAPGATYNHEYAYRPGSVGTPVELVEVKVVDPEGREVPPGTWGEIVIQGPNVMLGYWNRPEETAQAIRDGWFHSGDIGYKDDDGYIYIVDRVKDMINAAGFKIWPREVEEVLYQHPAIRECAVVGVPDPIKGEVARAYIVLQPGAQLTAAALEEYCRSQLAAYKVPRQVEFVPELPKSAAGKILKRVLRDQAAAAGR